MSVQARFGMPLEDGGRSKTILNGNQRVLVAAPGCEITIAQAEDGSPAAPQRVLIFPIDQIYETFEYDPEKDKLKKIKIEINNAWISEMRKNTLEVWGDRYLPIMRNHVWQGEASGWFRAAELEVDTQGLWMRAEWIGGTDRLIAERKFRYVSPGWWMKTINPATGKTLDMYLQEVSITNVPYFRQQPGLAADAGPIILAALSAAATINQTEEVDMDPKQLAELLGLTPEADEEEVLSAIRAAAAGVTELNTIKTALALAQGETAEGKIKALQAAKPAPEETPPAAGETKPAQAEAQAMGAAAAELLIDAAVAAGKIPPKARDPWIKAAAAVPLADAQALLAAIPKAVPDADALKDKAKQQATAAVSDEVLRACGMTRKQIEDFGPKADQDRR